MLPDVFQRPVLLPVFAIYFLEHGLSWEEFGILNGIWAITIILLEVPSGSLADTLGRKRLLVIAGTCMVLEMLALLFAPMDGSAWVFSLFAINRIISGVAEAAASGADEALAYDSLKEAGMHKEWGKVLEKAQRYTSLAFFFAMMTGSAFYDSDFVNSCLSFLGFDFSISDETSIKIPIFLTFISSLIVLGSALGLKENSLRTDRGALQAIRSSLRKTQEAGLWILTTALPFGILIAAMIIDSVIRQFLTIASAYWSVIELPLWTFGLVASGMSLMGLLVPRLARWLADRNSPEYNFFLICAFLTAGLFGIGHAFPFGDFARRLALCFHAMHELLDQPIPQRTSLFRAPGYRTELSRTGDQPFLWHGLASLFGSDRMDQDIRRRAGRPRRKAHRTGGCVRRSARLVPMVFSLYARTRRPDIPFSLCKKITLNALLA